MSKPDFSDQHIATFLHLKQMVKGAVGAGLNANGDLAPIAENISSAEEFLKKASDLIGIKKTGEAEINPVPNGSVDVVWRTGKGHLLINFRQPEKGIAHYYFDQYDEQLGRQGAFRVDEPLPADLKIHLKSL